MPAKKKRPTALSDSASWLINAGIDDMKHRLNAMTGTAGDIYDLEIAIKTEKETPKLSGGNRTTRLTPLVAKLKSFQSASSTLITDHSALGTSSEIPSPESLITGDVSTLSPAEVSSLSTIARLEEETGEMIAKTKGLLRAASACQALTGINLQHLRTHYIGPVNPNGGRPKKSKTSGGFNWASYLADKYGITDSTADRWIKTGQAVLMLAEAQGTDLRTICEKLPWHWTAEENAFVETTFQTLCKDKTQRQLLQSDFLESLGYENSQDKHGTNNPAGNNGGKKQPASSPETLLEERRQLARLDFYGVRDPGKMKPGSPVAHMEAVLNHKHHNLLSLPKAELQDLADNTLAPLLKLIRESIK